LTDEIYQLQNELASKIELTKNTIEQYDLPHVLPSNSPIFYIGLGLPRVGYNMVRRLLSEGFYTNIGIFPGVPVKCCGLRLAVTNGQTHDDIRNVLKAFRYHFPKALEEEGQTVEDISNNFNLPFEETSKQYAIASQNQVTDSLDIQHETTIHNIDKAIWDDLLGDIGTFDWEGCRFIEETFCDNPEPENNWQLHYVIIRDQNKKPILATYFTELLCKDDMIASPEASKRIEEVRVQDKYYLTSKVVMMGSLLSLGDHLYIDKKYTNWQNALKELLRIMNEVKQKSGASTIQLRDLDSNDKEISDFLVQEGFIKIEMPDIHTVTNLNWKTENEYLSHFSSKSRWHFKKMILDKRNNFDVRVLSSMEDKAKGDPHKWFKLYSNVKDRAFNINTYSIPLKYFTNIIHHPNWEIIELRLKPDEISTPDNKGDIVSVSISYKSSRNNYSFYAVGLDYDYVLSHGSYRQGIYQCLLRAHDLKCGKLFLGMDASIEKKRFGVSVVPVSAYVQANDNFNMELIGRIHTKAA
jgi:hypothetical protein